MKHVLVTMPMTEAQKARLLCIVPDAEVDYHPLNDMDPSRMTLEQVLAANIVLGNVSPQKLAQSTNIEWVQLSSAGVDWFTRHCTLPKGMILTNSSGAYGHAVAEHMLGMLLMLMRKLNCYCRNQMMHNWTNCGKVTTLESAVVLVVGLGDIGRHFAKMCKGMDSYVIGVKRTPGEKLPYVDELYTVDQLDELLPRADVVALALPSTDETWGMFNRAVFEKIKPGAYLVNAGRGRTVDTDALVEALSSGRLAGAALDVTDPEPLPEDHPLWDMENVVITPHVSGPYNLMERTGERVAEIALKNLERFMKGEPLVNVEDPCTGK